MDLTDKIAAYSQHIAERLAKGEIDADTAAQDIAGVIAAAHTQEDQFEDLLETGPE